MNKGFQNYVYKGEPIEDIDKWAAERHEKRINVKRTVKTPNMFTGKIDVEIHYMRMPESMWHTMRISGNEHWETVNE